MDKRTRKTKAGLQRVVNQQQKDLLLAINTHNTQQTLIDQNAHDIKFLKQKLDDKEKSYQALLIKHHEEVAERREAERKLRGAVMDLAEMTTDRDNWKRCFQEEQRGKREARELLIRQAHLAGEIAKLTGNVALKNG